MDFLRLQVFRAVARQQSFSRAAVDLHLSQPAVSKHIRQLEAELGSRLFRRLGNRVELTDAGRIVADYAQRVSVLTEEVRRVLGELAGLQRGYLRLGASTTPGVYLLPNMLARFQKKYPDVDTTLAITNSAEVTRRVLSGEFDLGFVGAPTEAAGLHIRPLADDTIVLIAPTGHTLSKQQTLRPEIFDREVLIVREPGSATRQIAEAQLARLGLTPKRVVEMMGCEGVKQAVAAGLGIAFVSQRTITLELAQKLLTVSAIPELHFARQLFVLTRKDARPSAAALAFLALLGKGSVKSSNP